MDFEKFTERARGFVQSAQSLALREGHQRFTPEHLLKVLLDDEEGLAAGLIKTAGGDPQGGAARDRGRSSKSCRGSRARERDKFIWPRRRREFSIRPQKLANKAGDSFVTAERLLQALAIEKSEASRILKAAGVTPQALKGHQRAAQGAHRRHGVRRAGL